ncbi:hypothetical protein A3Q56_06784 [Intoshia linei]|uniref:Uncharacterized protein n=1 Tax=Intoshia linei TaxID=1819745 RepID=A0A177AWB9_9BILA|nr:hypothetical protein A3Q56_06784 [Intoshia linei]
MFDSIISSSTPLLRFNHVLYLLNQKYIQQKIYQACAIRFDIEIQLRVVATKFHYGQVMGLFKPGPHVSMTLKWHYPYNYVKTREGVDDSSRNSRQLNNLYRFKNVRLFGYLFNEITPQKLTLTGPTAVGQMKDNQDEVKNMDSS